MKEARGELAKEAAVHIDVPRQMEKALNKRLRC